MAPVRTTSPTPDVVMYKGEQRSPTKLQLRVPLDSTIRGYCTEMLQTGRAIANPRLIRAGATEVVDNLVTWMVESAAFIEGTRRAHDNDEETMATILDMYNPDNYVFDLAKRLYNGALMNSPHTRSTAQLLHDIIGELHWRPNGAVVGNMLKEQVMKLVGEAFYEVWLLVWLYSISATLLLLILSLRHLLGRPLRTRNL